MILKSERKSFVFTLVLSLMAVGFMFYVEQVLKPGYFLKSFIKVLCFGSVILLYSFLSRKKLTRVINLKKPVRWKGALLLGILGEITILTLFYFLKDLIDLSGLRNSLMTKEGLTKENCLFILLYIICVNSFLEESFFRGFLFHSLKEKVSGIGAAFISAFLFAVYHIGIVSGWFNPVLLILCIALLMAAGLLLQYVEEKNDSLISSWMIHALCNGAINSIGAMLILFG